MVGSEDAKSLSLGVVSGGMQSRTQAWKTALVEWMMRIEHERNEIELKSPLNVNVVFHIPGEIIGTLFDGVRDARLSRTRRLLMIQVQVPDMDPPPNTDTFILDRIDEAVSLAEEVGTRKKLISQPLTELRQFVKSLRRLGTP